MVPLYEYSQMNDFAIRSAMHGDLSNASSVLSKCIKQLDHLTDPAVRHPAMNSLKEVKTMRCIHLPRSDLEGEVSPGNLFEFYPVMFSLPPPCHNISASLFEDLLLSCMMLNMAVLHHQNAMQKGCSRRLKCAMKLYQLATGVLRRWYMAESAKSVLFYASINMAHIHGHFHNMDQANACFECAFTLLESVQDYIPEGVVGDIISQTSLVAIGQSTAAAA